MPMAGEPSAEMAEARRLFKRPAKTITATSRVSRLVTRRPATKLLSMPMRLSVAVKRRPPPWTTRISWPCWASAAICRARARTTASSSSKAPASVIKNFGSVAMREQVVGLEIFVDLDEVEVATGIFACAAGTGLAVADDAAALGDEAGFGERAQGENHAGGVAAGIGNKARGGDFSSVQLGKTVDRFAEPACVGSGELVPGRKGIRGAKTEGAAEIDDAEASLQQRGGDFRGNFVGRGEESGARIAGGNLGRSEEHT